MGKKKEKKKRKRTRRREAERKAKKMVEARRKLQLLEPGGAVDRPLEVQATSQIDGVVRGLTCAACEGPLSIEHEVGHVRAGRVMRELRLGCRRCAEVRILHVALASTPTLN